MRFRTVGGRLALASGPLLVAAIVAARSESARQPSTLPPIVFVSRQPIPSQRLAIPGLGPHHRAVITGGRLLVREPDGRIRDLLPAGTLHDVSDPAVSFDGRRIAFSGTPDPDSAWRIYVVEVDGSDLHAVTFTDGSRDLSSLGTVARRFERYDDLDPCWIGSSLCFASTRYPQRSQYGDLPVTNLYMVPAPAGNDPERATPRRLTSERNGAEEPAVDPRTGKLVFSRWWFNRHRPATSSGGLTTGAVDALPGDSVNLWQAMEMSTEGLGIRLACGDLRSRRGTMTYQPTVLPNGTIVGVYGANLGLSPHSGGTGIQSFPARFGEALRLAGAAVSDRPGDAYSSARGLAPPSACSPAGLPDGRVLFAYAPGARGDFGIYVVDRNGSRLQPVVDLARTLELDPAPIVRRPEPRVALPTTRGSAASSFESDSPPPLPVASESGLAASGRGFRFDCLNVFANAPVDAPIPDAPPIRSGLRIRFFATLSRPDAQGGDTAVLVRESPVGPQGRIREDGLPAHVPMFEQLVDSGGNVLMTAHPSFGPRAAHVAGLNVNRESSRSRCLGCHTGHSTLLREPPTPQEPEWFNASTSAEVTASSVAQGALARAVVDRRTRGEAWSVGWIAANRDSQAVRLEWPLPLEIRELVLYNVRRDPRNGTDLRVRSCRVRLFWGGREVARRTVTAPLSPEGTRVRFGSVMADAVEVRLTTLTGRVSGRELAALAEVETIARLTQEWESKTPTPGYPLKETKSRIDR